MHILACVKQTPKSENVKIDPATGCLVRSGMESAMNPYDEYALETAVMLKEQLGGTVSVITMGPPAAEKVLRDSIARGADNVYQLGDIAFAGSDTWSTSYALATGAQKIDALQKIDVIICGKQTNDSDTGHIGPQISAWLGWPNAAFVRRIIKTDEKSITVERLTENGTDVLQLPYPCVISVVKEISSPRVAGVKGRLAAKRAEVVKWTADDIGADKNKLGIKNCPTRVVKSFSPQRDHQAVVVSGTTSQEKAAHLITLLKENKYL